MIHPAAIVDATATIGDGVTIGPFAIIGPGAVLGDGCRIAERRVSAEGQEGLHAFLEKRFAAWVPSET